jgi:hypothetical protein
MSNNVRLLVTGPGRKGLIAAVSSFVEAHNGYILEVDEHLNSPASGKWFMRIEIEGESFDLDKSSASPSPLWRDGTSIACWISSGVGMPVSRTRRYPGGLQPPGSRSTGGDARHLASTSSCWPRPCGGLLMKGLASPDARISRSATE